MRLSSSSASLQVSMLGIGEAFGSISGNAPSRSPKLFDEGNMALPTYLRGVTDRTGASGIHMPHLRGRSVHCLDGDNSRETRLQSTGFPGPVFPSHGVCKAAAAVAR